MKKTLKKSLLLVMMAVMLTVLTSMSAFAATKSISVKGQKFTTSVVTARKKATTVKKGTYKVKLGSAKENGGYMKFTAPRTKTYSFTFSSVAPVRYRSESDKIIFGHAYIMVPASYSSNMITMGQVSTKGGLTTSIKLRSSYNYKPESPIETSTNLPSRTAKIKLAKGQTVYPYAWFTSQSYVKLVIK